MNIGGVMKKSSSSYYFVCCFCIFAVLSAITAASGLVLSSSYSHAVEESVVASVTVDSACSMSGGNSYSRTIREVNAPLTPVTTTITADPISIVCNDAFGFDIYAVGYSGDSYYTNNTDLIHSSDSTSNIKTDGTGGASYWKMKIETSGASNLVTIDNNYDSYSNIPSDYTKIAHYGSNITSGTSTIVPSYQIYISTSQPKGSYTGKVQYTIVHPNNTTAPEKPVQLPDPPTTCNIPVTGVTYMQDINATNKSTILANMTEDGRYYLYDKRDNKPYCVGKLRDGNVWMLDNLAIDLTATSYNDLYGTGDNAGKMTNATSEALGYLKGNTAGTTSDQWATAAVRKDWTSSFSHSVPLIAVDSATSGICKAPTTWCVDTTGNGAWSWDTVTPATINGNTSKAQGKLGVYYNYCAASAGSYCWGNGTSFTGSPSSDPNTSSLRDITSDICPYGWHLPTSTSSGEFAALYTAYDSNVTNFQTALSTPVSGWFDSNAGSQGANGFFWSSTWNNQFNMYSLFVSSTSVDRSDHNARVTGVSVRCLVNS